MRIATRLVAVCLASAAVLASCGGGSDRVATAPTTSPPALAASDTVDPGSTTVTTAEDQVTTLDPAAITSDPSSGVSSTTAGGPSTSASTTTAGGAVASSSSVKPSTSSSVKPTSSSVKPVTSSSVAPSTSAKPPVSTTGGTKSITVDADQPPRTISVAWGTDVTLTITSSKVQDFHVHAPIDTELSGTSVTFRFSTDFGPADMGLLAGGDTLMAESHTTGKPVVYLVIG